MLHRINLPDCTTHLEWIVQLQRDLLHALCDPALDADGVTKEWVKSIRPDIDGDWMSRFCGWSTGGKSMLQRMKAVADLSTGDKRAAIQHYKDNLKFPNAFDETKPDPPATAPLPDGLSKAAAKAYRDFFEMFYAPIFYGRGRKGYPVEGGEPNKRFSKLVYLDAYREANEHLKVCPLCDGSMDGAELDHWLAKKHLPELNCHPLNLVEICPACNSVTNKGEKLALDKKSPQPFDSWFHPLLRTAEGQYKIEVCNGKPRLKSDDPQVQARLDKLDWLINLSSRWARKYDNLVSRIQDRIRHHRRRKGPLDENTLLSMIDDWAIDVEAELGRGEHKIIEAALLRVASIKGSNVFLELMSYAVEVVSMRDTQDEH